MELYIYSDESGTFDYIHNDYFVFGGLLFLSKEEMERYSRLYRAAENVIRKEYKRNEKEIKGSNTSNVAKGKLFRSLNNAYKFGIIVKQKELQRKIFSDSRHKQRYLDFIYKVGLKMLINKLIDEKIIKAKDVRFIYVYCDEHHTATDAIYELKESLYAEFKIGTFNQNYEKFFEPVFPKLLGIDVKYCNSENKTLIRAADIIANKLYHLCLNEQISTKQIPNMAISFFPSCY